MKSAFVLVLALCAVASAYPRNAREDTKEDGAEETELFIVPLQRDGPRRPSIRFDLSEDLMPPPFEHHPFFSTNPWGEVNPAGGDQVNDFMTQMQEMLKEMRKQLTDMIQHHHHATEDLPDNTSVSVGTGISEDQLPHNKSTSTTKVIDGHVVTVNETTYSSGDDNIGAVFRIKVVEVKPSETPENGTDTVDKSTELDESSEEPKVPEPTMAPEPTKSKSELEEDKFEETNEIPNQKVGSEVEDLLA